MNSNRFDGKKELCTRLGLALLSALIVSLSGLFLAVTTANAQNDDSGIPGNNQSGAVNPLGGTTAPSPGPVATAPNGNKYAEGELIVTYKDERDAQSEQHEDGEVLDTISQLGIQHLEFEDIKSEESSEDRKKLLEAEERQIERDNDVESVDLNYLMEPNWVPNDKALPRQVNALPVVRAQQGWNISRGASARIVVIDSGIDTDHPEFSGTKVAGKRNFVTGTANVEDRLGHGTKVASIASGATNNRVGIAGGAPYSRLLIAKVARPNGYYDLVAAVAAIRWGTDNGGDAINMSFGAPGNLGKPMQNALNYAWSKGAVPVASSGNTGRSGTNYPASYNHVVGVAGVNGGGGRAHWSTSGRHVDLSAPGVDILAASPGSTYRRDSGTSFAAPHASALVALLESQKPSRGADEKYLLMRNTARDMGARGRDSYYGYGRINYEAALKRGR